MSTLSIRLPNSLHEATKQFVQKEHVSMNQFIMLAVAEKLSCLATEDLLKTRAKRGDRKKFLAVLKKVPNVLPDEKDRL